MKRPFLLLALSIAAGFVPATPASASNVEYNFNNKLEGWTFHTTTPGSLFWEWQPGTSSAEGALHAWIGNPVPASGQVAWAESPLFELSQQGQPVPQPYVHVDFSHWTDLPVGGTTTPIDPLALGQVQFRYMRTTDAAWSDWLAAPIAWSGTTQGHHPPDAPPSPPPLAADGASFAGRTTDFPNHVTSAFDIDWNAFTPALDNGDLITFRFLVGVTADLPIDRPAGIVWELNSVGIDGVRVAAVPEPGGPALAGGAAATGLLVALVRRRLRRAAG